MFNPITVAAAAKVAARAELRTKKILSLTAKQYRLKQAIEEITKSAEATAKRTAHLNWETEQAESNGNPDAEAIKENNEKAIASLTKEAESYTNRVADLKKEIAGLQEKIDDVVSGKRKFDYERILALADGFIRDSINNAFASGEFDKEEIASESR
jgi:hypothetical protein